MQSQFMRQLPHRNFLDEGLVFFWYLIESAEVVEFSYSSDFDCLWGINNGGIKNIANALSRRGEDHPLDIIIRWDTTPVSDGKDIVCGDCVSPIDWFVALLLAMDEYIDLEWPLLRLIIIEDGSLYRHIFSKRMLPLIAAELGCVKCFAYAEANDILSEIDQPVSFSAIKDLKLLKTLWRANLTKSGSSSNRHSLSNVIAPVVLLKNLGVDETDMPFLSRTSKALLILMECIGLIPAKFVPETLPWVRINPARSGLDAIVLLDDMHSHGWSRFLEKVVGVGACDFRCYDDPSDLLSFLEKSSQKQIILFLDLRLFGNSSVDCESKFYQSLLEIASRLEPLKGVFAAEELLAINRFIHNKERENDDYFEALTVFPRLLATQFPGLPIILFSSSSQKNIYSKLSNYRNIIVDFDKPRFFNDATESTLSLAKAKFSKAVDKALRICRSSKICHDSLKLPYPQAATSPSGTNFVEVYFDESGSLDTLAVGGLILSYPDKNSARDFSASLRKEGIVWGWDRDCPWSAPGTSSLLKASSASNQDISSIFASIDHIASSCGIEIGYCRLGPYSPGLFNLRPLNNTDVYFRELLRYLMEILIFEWAAFHKGPNDPVDMSLFVATRVLPDSLFLRDPSKFLELQHRFGLNIGRSGSTPNQNFYCLEKYDLQKEGDLFWQQLSEHTVFDVKGNPIVNAAHVSFPNISKPAGALRAYSFGFDGVYPILNDIQARRCRNNVSIRCACGVGLKYSNQFTPLSPHQLPRQIHYAADYAISKPFLVPSKWKENGFIDAIDSNFVHAINACRFADSDTNPVDALCEWSKVAIHEQYSFTRYVKSSIRPLASSVIRNPALLVDLADRL